MVRNHLLAFCCACAVASSTAAGAYAAESHRILVVYSDGRLLPANIEADDAFRAAFTDSDEPVEIISEFIDRARFGGDAYAAALRDFLRVKYATHQPQVLVAAGVYAIQFLLSNRATLFNGVPIVYVGISSTEVQALRPLPPDVIGVPVIYDYQGSIEMALRLHPRATRLVLITGSDPVSRSNEVFMRRVTDPLTDRITIEMLSGLSVAALKERLRALGPNDVVFTPGFFTDGVGRQFTPRDSAKLIAAASNAPVYGPYSTFIGTGIVGGRMPTWRTIGLDAAGLAKKLIDGVRPEAIDVPKAAASTTQIDWRQARRWGITEDQLPADAIVHFREPTFWEAYGRIALISLAVILLQTALIGRLLLERRLQRRTAAALQDSQRNLSLAAATARLTTWVWDTLPRRSRPPGPAHSADGSTPLHFDDVLQTVHPADREVLTRAVHDVVERGRELDVVYRTIRDGHVAWNAARGRADDDDQSRLRGVALDITARKSAELQAEEDRNALRHMTRVSLLGQLSASIAHQLNQPLAAILANAEAARTILSRNDLDIDELRSICEDIISEDHRAAAVIRRLGALFKRGDISSAPLEINELIVETLDLLRSDLMTRHVAITKALTPQLPRVVGDRVQLQQILMNLVMNAADAMDAIPESQRAAQIHTDAVERVIRISIADCGPGIAEQNLERVFDPFWSTKAGGMGIGLAMCRSIASAHGGTLSVTNNEAGGATFRLTLPVE